MNAGNKAGSDIGWRINYSLKESPDQYGTDSIFLLQFYILYIPS